MLYIPTRTESRTKPSILLCATAVYSDVSADGVEEMARSTLSLARSAQAERDNESCFFVRAADVHRLIRPCPRCLCAATGLNVDIGWARIIVVVQVVNRVAGAPRADCGVVVLLAAAAGGLRPRLRRHGRRQRPSPPPHCTIAPYRPGSS
ncbi:hypothetical protein EVAR_50627_1 [Eumeta japonica]|uniref:Uncharacterized protein n=1 Tax=Eumeta variegata TaxID=151549 RepID=A0A4C1XHC7_EUMVA|nr:hypothetical protein EVAR_50627_1 [Eumeta japonica]